MGALLSDGNIAVAYALRHIQSGVPDSYEIWVNIYQPDGTQLGQSINIGQNDQPGTTVDSIAALADGGFVVTSLYISSVAGGDPPTKNHGQVQIFNSDGSQRGATIAVPGATFINVAAFDTGKFVIDWSASGTVTEQLYNSDGTTSGSPILVSDPFAVSSLSSVTTPIIPLSGERLIDFFQAPGVGGATHAERMFGPLVRPPAVAQVSGVIDFGIVHVHDASVGWTDAVTGNLVVTNVDPDPQSELLAGGPGAITGTGFVALGDLGAGLASGQTGSVLYTFSTAQAGVFVASGALALASRDESHADVPLSAGPVTLTGTVNNYAAVQILPGPGNWGFGDYVSAPHDHYLSLGTFLLGAAAPSVQLLLTNAVSGPADLLGGNFTVAGTAGFSNSGLETVSGLIAGAVDGAPMVTLLTAQGGTFSETLTFHGTGSNASGFSQNLPDETVIITGLIAYSLTTGADSVAAGDSNDLIITTADALNAGDRLDGGGGVNTLQLSGGGNFRIAVPQQFDHIQVVTAQEGRTPYSLGGGPPTESTRQIVTLRSGIDITLNVLPAPADPNNPLIPGIIVRGANDNSIINLANGNDTVYLGSSHETVIAHGGADQFRVTAGSIGATMDGGVGVTTLIVSGGGAMTMGSNIFSITTVALLSATSRYVFTANSIPHMTILGSTSSDTIIVGAANQIVSAGNGDDVILASAANAGARIDGGLGANTLEITTGGTVTLDPGTKNVTILLDGATNLMLSSAKFIVFGSGGQDVIRAGGSGQVLSGRAGSDVLDGRGFGVTFRDTSAALSGDTIIGLSSSKGIDATDLDPGTAHLSWLQGSGLGLLSLTDGFGHGAAITLEGTFATSHFHILSDGAAGTTITYV